MPVCPKCGSDVRPGYKFCTKCGQPMDVFRSVNQNSSKNITEDMPLNHKNTANGALDDIEIVHERAIWSIQPTQLARRITESEFTAIENLKGVVIQDGCSAVVYIDGDLVGILASGSYTFLNESLSAGLLGKGMGLVELVKKFLFGTKDQESNQKKIERQQIVEEKLKRKDSHSLVRIYLISNRLVTLTFGGDVLPDGSCRFEPIKVASKYVDVELGISMQFHVNNVTSFAINYLTTKESFSSIDLQKLVSQDVEILLKNSLRNFEYQGEGLPEALISVLKSKVQTVLNDRLQGIEVVKILDITDNSSDFTRFRNLSRELYLSETELEFLQRTGEFKNRLAIETNNQAVSEAQSESDLRYTLAKINQDDLLRNDEIEAFVNLLESQKRVRNAKTEEEEYAALQDLKKNILIKEDEVNSLQDSFKKGEIERGNVLDLMRLKSAQNVEEARLRSELALSTIKAEHEISIREKQDEYDFNRHKKFDNYDWEKRQREYNLQKQVTNDELEILRAKQQMAVDANIRMQEAEMLAEKQRLDYENEKLQIESTMTQEQIAASHMKDIANLDSAAQIELAKSMGSGKEKEIEMLRENQQREQELYEKMLAMQSENQKMQNSSTVQQGEQTMKMMEMMMTGISQLGQNALAGQKQRYDDMSRMKEEYRDNMMHQQERIDDNQKQALNYITRSDKYTRPSNKSDKKDVREIKWCGTCGAKISSDTPFCPECGASQD